MTFWDVDDHLTCQRGIVINISLPLKSLRLYHRYTLDTLDITLNLMWHKLCRLLLVAHNRKMVIDVIIANRATHNSVWLKTTFGTSSKCNSSRLYRSETKNILKEPFPKFNLLSKPVVEPHLSTSLEFVGSFSIKFDFIQQTCQIPASHWK